MRNCWMGKNPAMQKIGRKRAKNAAKKRREIIG